MFKLYVEKMLADSLPFVKVRKYQIFTHEYNLGFHQPKGDSCDKCAEFKAIPSNLRTPEQLAANKKHEDGKEAVQKQRHEDVAITDPKTLVVSFDLENVLALPHTTVTFAFFKCKPNV